MKGIESIIAIILILMIVIALAALAYTWFSGVFANLTGTVGTSVTTTTNAMATQFRIEAARYDSTYVGTNVTIRNTGTQNINVSKSSTYIGGKYETFSGVTTTTLTPGNVATIYKITNSSAACSAIISVTIETGISDSRTISC